MNITLLRRARLHFVHDMAPVRTQRHNMRQWAKSLRFLGDKHILAKQVGKRHV